MLRLYSLKLKSVHLLAGVNIKSKRFHQMESNRCGCAGPGHATSVLRNLRVDKYQVEVLTLLTLPVNSETDLQARHGTPAFWKICRALTFKAMQRTFDRPSWHSKAALVLPFQQTLEDCV